MRAYLKQAFPNLETEGFDETSPASATYNCRGTVWTLESDEIKSLVDVGAVPVTEQTISRIAEKPTPQ
jgi:hypothetical protein